MSLRVASENIKLNANILYDYSLRERSHRKVCTYNALQH